MRSKAERPAERYALGQARRSAGLSAVERSAAGRAERLRIENVGGHDAVAAEQGTLIAGVIVDLDVDVIARVLKAGGPEVIIGDPGALVRQRNQRDHLLGRGAELPCG